MKQYFLIQRKEKYIAILLMLVFFDSSYGQTLSLKEAINKGVSNYGVITAKKNYVNASNENIARAKREYLPNVNLSAQQNYGTVNGQNGAMYGLNGLGVSSSGPVLPEQNWNATFGALYLMNVNWEFFNFGRTQQQIRLAKFEANINKMDYEQEIFQHKIKIAATYLNLLASCRLLSSQEKNLQRTNTFYNNVVTRVKNGLLPGVDSVTASAEVSKARILLNQTKELVKTQNNELSSLLGEESYRIVPDTTFINRIPHAKFSNDDNYFHPTKLYFESKIEKSLAQEKLYKKQYMPSFLLYGVYQTRASGFNSDYGVNQASFSKKYFDGISPNRQNYLFGIGVTWNLTSISRSRKSANAQKWITLGLEEEYKAIDIELRNREDAANARFEYAIESYKEAPLQVISAQKAYIQRLTLYNNGLNTLTDVINAQYLLSRAETDRDIAFVNVWQALLMKAAANGDFNLFINEF